MFHYSIERLTDQRYGIYVGQTLLASVGTSGEAKAILHRLTQKQLEQSIAAIEQAKSSAPKPKRQRMKVI
jgi:16S rRNA C1402 N4-methylase RsmH